MGGGVSIYIRDLFNLEIIKYYSKSIESICDIVTIKISNKSLNNKVCRISGINISPTYDIVLFNDFLYIFFNSISNNNDTFICGDFNIDILNKNKLLLIDNFIDLFYQSSFFPTINKLICIQNNVVYLFTYPMAFGCRRGAVDFNTIRFHRYLSRVARIASSIPRLVHSTILSCHCVLGRPLLLLPSMDPCKIVLYIEFARDT